MRQFSKQLSIGWMSVAGVLVIWVAAALLIAQQYRGYQEKLTMAVQVLAESEDEYTFSTLKGSNDTISQEALDMLSQYGYDGWNRNVYGREWFSISCQIAAGGLLLSVGYVAVLALCSRKCFKEKTQWEHSAAEALQALRDGQTEFVSFEEDGPIAELLEELAGYLALTKEQAFREREETKALVTDLSHQLKTPVSTLQTCFEVFENQDLSAAERAEFQSRMGEQLDGLQQLVNALVNISRMETGMIVVKRVEQKLFDTILEAVNRVWVKADQKHIAVHLTANGLEDVRILHDRKWMCEAIVNILENAVKYSPSHTVVTIGLEKRAHFVRIQISDEGIGIEKSEYHKIFQRFYRGSRPEVQSQDGAGVGLYLSRKIVEDHQGMIMADSTNQGTTFVIALPFAQ